MTTRLRAPAAATRHRPRGFTLIEIMIALVAFTLLTLVFAAVVPVTRKANRLNAQYTQAISLCQHKIDQLRAVGHGRLNYTELSNAQIIDPAPNASPFSFKGVDGVATFLPSATATVTVTDVTSRIRNAAVTIEWRNADTDRVSRLTLWASIANVE